MNIKKFIADTSRDALQMVMEEMGPEAVILETRTINSSGGHSGCGKEKIEVTAAIDYDAALKDKGGELKLSQEVFLEKWKGLEGNLRQIMDYLFALEAMSSARGDYFPEGFSKDQYIYYRHFGLEPNVIRFLSKNNKRAAGSELSLTEKRLKECLIEVVKNIKIGNAKKQDKKVRIYSFIGPTGVGKTTTMAKLAAVYAVEEKKKVALITVDTFRIGAVSQLETYASIMGIPLEVANNSNELAKAITKYSAYDIILIDTAGRSPNSEKDIGEIVKVFQVPASIHHYLVLSATTQLDNMLIAQKRFSTIPFKSYIFTKLDEVTDASAMINFLIMADKPVSYFTTGQSVPEDIEPANRKRIAEMILKRNKSVSYGSYYEVRRYGSSQQS